MGFKTLSNEVIGMKYPKYLEGDVQKILERIRQRLRDMQIGIAIKVIDEEVGDRLCSQSNDKTREE